MKYVLQCLSCGYQFDETSFCTACPQCGGVIDPVIQHVKKARVDYRHRTIMRYHEFLPVDDVSHIASYERACPTPLVSSPLLAKACGFHHVLLKDETVSHTGTLKDREGLLTIYRLMKHKIPGLVIASSGNAGIAIAYYASIMKKAHVYLFLPQCSQHRMMMALQRFTDPSFVTVYHVEGSMDEASIAAKEFAQNHDVPYGTGFRNYSRREGVKTLALEYLLEQRQRADWYVQGVAGALAVHAFYKAHKELGVPCPHLLGVQPDACSPFVDAYHAHAEELTDAYIPKEPVIVPEAPVLKTRRPVDAYPIIKKEVDETHGSFEKVSRDEIQDALSLFYTEPYFVSKYQKTHVQIGLEAATALAGAIKAREEDIIHDDETVLINVSGCARPGDIPIEWWDAIDV